MDNASLQQVFKRIQLLKFQYFGSFSPENVPTLDNDTFANINTPPSNLGGERWRLIENSRHKLYFADFLGHEMYSFFKQQYNQMIWEPPLQSHSRVCGFYTIYAAFYLLKFCHDKITGVRGFKIFSFISFYM